MNKEPEFAPESALYTMAAFVIFALLAAFIAACIAMATALSF